MNPRALDRLDRRQLLQLEYLSLQYLAWVELALLLQRLGMPAAFALKRARQARGLIEQVLQ